MNIGSIPREIPESERTLAGRILIVTLVAANLISDVHEGIGRIGRIPVRNLWLLMLYASDLFRESRKGEGLRRG